MADKAFELVDDADAPGVTFTEGKNKQVSKPGDEDDRILSFDEEVRRDAGIRSWRIIDSIKLVLRATPLSVRATNIKENSTPDHSIHDPLFPALYWTFLTFHTISWLGSVAPDARFNGTKKWVHFFACFILVHLAVSTAIQVWAYPHQIGCYESAICKTGCLQESAYGGCTNVLESEFTIVDTIRDWYLYEKPINATGNSVWATCSTFLRRSSLLPTASYSCLPVCFTDPADLFDVDERPPCNDLAEERRDDLYCTDPVSTFPNAAPPECLLPVSTFFSHMFLIILIALPISFYSKYHFHYTDGKFPWIIAGIAGGTSISFFLIFWLLPGRVLRGVMNPFYAAASFDLLILEPIIIFFMTLLKWRPDYKNFEPLLKPGAPRPTKIVAMNSSLSRKPSGSRSGSGSRTGKSPARSGDDTLPGSSSRSHGKRKDKHRSSSAAKKQKPLPTSTPDLIAQGTTSPPDSLVDAMGEYVAGGSKRKGGSRRKSGSKGSKRGGSGSGRKKKGSSRSRR